MADTDFVRGRLEANETTIEIEFQATVVQRGNDWSGEFFVEGDVAVGEYDLVTEDGRRGKIVVKRVYPGSGSTRCEFEGVGELN